MIRQRPSPYGLFSPGKAGSMATLPRKRKQCRVATVVYLVVDFRKDTHKLHREALALKERAASYKTVVNNSLPVALTGHDLRTSDFPTLFGM